MIVSWDWLRDYVDFTATYSEMADRFALSGLNFECFDDATIDLEVTSNRADCLGHIGVAREVAVLYGAELRLPSPPWIDTDGQEADSEEVKRSSDFLGVKIDAPHLCRLYSAQVIKGVKIGPSPKWLADRLQAIGVALVNNVVDVTNYVMMECGQPLHAFDLSKLRDKRIVVRESIPGEKFTAINHQTYEVPAGACVITDGQGPIALAGVMGGAESEVSDSTTDLLVETAIFEPLAIRNTARRLHLHSPSSYRYERGIDDRGVPWAAARAYQLILEVAGGECVHNQTNIAGPVRMREEIKLRWAQLPQILGIEVPVPEVQKILTALGCEETHICDHCIKVIPPSWRADLTREIDLIEEVARIYGYDKIPEDSNVKMAASTRTRLDRVLDRVRATLTAAGFDEAMTLSAVDETLVDAIQPWTDEAPLRASTAVLRRADCLRQTLVPSLLTARRHNEKLSNPVIELFEIANVYLPITGEIPQQKRLLAITSGGGFLELKGVLEALVARIAPSQQLQVGEVEYPLLDEARQCRLRLGEHTLGYLGELSKAGRERFELRGGSTVAEIDVELLIAAAELTPTAVPVSPYPPVGRDVNIVVNESIRWAEVERLVSEAGGELVESIQYQETYRDPQRLGAGKKSLLFTLQLRSATATLTNEEADGVRERIVAILAQQVGGELRA